MIYKIRKALFPAVEEDILRNMDFRSLNNIWYTSLIMLVFEAVSLIVFIATRKEFDKAAIASIRSVSFCIIACLLGISCSGMMKKITELPHLPVAIFNGCYYLLFTSWAIQVSMRNHANNEMILTFFAVQIMMVCFVPLNPLIGSILAASVYAILYFSLYRIDGAESINIFNYGLLLAVTVTGMVVRFHSEIVTAKKSVLLERSNEKLEYNYRHDGLTGLRNRRALEEDVYKIIGKPVTAYMIDVNYFKEINDTYGHSVGDRVLQDTATWIKGTFGDARYYRYGGDEFLILAKGEGIYKEDTGKFKASSQSDIDVLLSIGRAEGEPKDHDELFKLISAADNVLYEVKKRTHSPEFGGHGDR